MTRQPHSSCTLSPAAAHFIQTYGLVVRSILLREQSEREQQGRGKAEAA